MWITLTSATSKRTRRFNMDNVTCYDHDYKDPGICYDECDLDTKELECTGSRLIFKNSSTAYVKETPEEIDILMGLGIMRSSKEICAVLNSAHIEWTKKAYVLLKLQFPKFKGDFVGLNPSVNVCFFAFYNFRQGGYRHVIIPYKILDGDQKTMDAFLASYENSINEANRRTTNEQNKPFEYT